MACGKQIASYCSGSMLKRFSFLGPPTPHQKRSRRKNVTLLYLRHLPLFGRPYRLQ